MYFKYFENSTDKFSRLICTILRFSTIISFISLNIFTKVFLQARTSNLYIYL